MTLADHGPILLTLNRKLKNKTWRLNTTHLKDKQTEEMERNLKMAKCNFFENSNKPGRSLACKLKKER